MASIERLSIQGIRSFDPRNAQTIEFLKPLTIIVGPNGSGKTTIVECLRFATIGNYPKCNDYGHAFVHDLQFYNSQEVHAQTKLIFKSIFNTEITCARILKLQKTKTSSKLTALDTSLQARNLLTNEVASISTRCADIDKDIENLLSISKPILENVIFCHQEDNLWPLGEPLTLKKKFDDIFAATKFTKALASMIDLSKTKTTELKEHKNLLKILKTKKSQAEKHKVNLEADQRKVAQIDAEIERLTSEKTNMFQEMNRLQQMSDEIESINVKLAMKQNEKFLIEMNCNELLTHIRIVSEDEQELDELLEKLKGESRDYGELNQLENKKKNLEGTIKDLRSLLSKTHNNIGSYKAQLNTYQTKIGECKDMIQETASLYDLQDLIMMDYESISLEKVISEICDKLNEAIDGKKSILNMEKVRLVKQEESLKISLSDLERQLNILKGKTQSTVKEINLLNKAKVKFKKEINGTNVTEIDLNQLKDELDDAYANLGREKNRINDENIQSKINAERKARSKLQMELNKLDREISTLSKQADSVTKLQHKKEEQEKELKSLNSLIKSNETKLKEKLNKDLVIKSLNKDLGTLIKSYKIQNDKIIKKQQEIICCASNIDTQLKTLNLKKEKLHDKLKSCIKKIERECGNRNLGDVLKEEEEKLKDYQDQLSGYSYHISLYNKFLKECEDNNECSLCKHKFKTEEELGRLLSDLKEIINNVIPTRNESSKVEIKILEKRVKVLRNLEPSWNGINSLKDDISALGKEIDELSRSKCQTDLKKQEVAEKVKNLMDEIDDLDKLYKEAEKITNSNETIERFDSEISLLESELKSIGTTTKTLEKCMEERDDLVLKIKLIEENETKLMKKSNEDLEMLSKLQNTINEKNSVYTNDVFKFERLKQVSGQLIEIELKLAGYENEKNAFVLETTNLKSRIPGKKQELDGIKIQIADIEDTIAKEDNEVSGLIKNFGRIEKEIKMLENEGVEEKLAKSGKQVTDIEQEINMKMENLGKLEEKIQILNKSMTETKEQERNLIDNKKYVKYKENVNRLNLEIQDFEKRLIHLNYTNTKDQLECLKELFDSNTLETANEIGRKRELEEAIKRTNDELETNYQDIEKKHTEQDVLVFVSELAIKDLNDYTQALDKAIMRYHAAKIKEINSIIRHLWGLTYHGKDIDAIEIRTEVAGENVKKSHNYRVVMIRKGIEVDMRAKSSAGQRMLASIVIRLALAQAFCVKFGALALDEPTTNLDEENIKSLASSLRQLLESHRSQQNFQLIVITHDENFSELIGNTELSDYYYRVKKNESGYSVIEKNYWSEDDNECQ